MQCHSDARGFIGRPLHLVGGSIRAQPEYKLGFHRGKAAVEHRKFHHLLRRREADPAPEDGPHETILAESLLLEPESGGLPGRIGAFSSLATLVLAGPAVVADARRILAEVAASPARTASDILLGASPLGEHGVILRLAATSTERARYEIRRLLAQGALGEIVTVSADHGQWFAKDAAFRLFAPELGGGALLDLGVYPVSFASMVLGPPDRILALIDPAFTGVDGQTSMLFGYAGGAQAVLTCTLSAKSPTRAAIVGTEARIEIDGDFYAPNSFTLISRHGERRRFEEAHVGRGIRHEADEVARCLRAGLLESPLMPLDESISIMETMDAVLAQGQAGLAAGIARMS